VADATPVTVDASKEGSLLIAALQAEVAQLRLESSTTISELHQALQALREENQVLLRRLYGNKTERQNTNEAQLAFADLLKDQQALQRELNALLDDAGGWSVATAIPRARANTSTCRCVPDAACARGTRRLSGR
jgi:hypothetical protein